MFGRLATSGELESPHKMSDRHSTTMVRVPRSSGDSEFLRESLGEDARIKSEPVIEASVKEISSQACEDEGFLDKQVLGGAFFMTRKQKRKIIHSICTPTPS